MSKKEARAYEKRAAQREKGKGEFHTPLGKIHFNDPYNIAQDYESAARKWVAAKNPERAYKDYLKAAEVYSMVVESERNYIAKESYRGVSNKHNLRYKNA